MDWGMIGWREGVMLLVTAILLYVVVMLVRLTRVGRRQPPRQESEPPPQSPAIPEPAMQEPAMSPAEPVARAGGFGEHLAEHLARAETETEIRLLRQEIESLRAELEELRAARRVSPQYAEAMELSQRGLTAQDVADRLGISLAEAELVHALSRGERGFDLGDEDGEDADRNTGGHTIDGSERHRID